MPKPASRSDLVRIIRSLRFLLPATIAMLASWSDAAEPEVVAQHTREFRVSVDGTPRGTQSMTFLRHSDGSEIMRSSAEVVVNVIVYRYRYASVGKETWKDGRLIHLTNEADYNGDKYVIKGSATKQALHYQVNGESQQAPLDIWAASYWREPDAKRVGQKLRLLDSDKGRQLTATLERLNAETIKANSASIKANRYRMRGDVEVDVWYDRHGFIARQESVESGHKTLLELTKIHRSSGDISAESGPPGSERR